MDRYDAGLGVARDVHGAKVALGASGCLEEGGDEFAGGWEGAEVGHGEELEEDVVAEDVGDGVGREVVGGERGGRGVEDGVWDGEEREGGAVGEVGGDGGEEGCEVGVGGEWGEEGGDVDGEGWGWG